MCYRGGSRLKRELRIPLPNTILKYFETSFLDITAFKQKWKNFSHQQILFVDNLSLNPKLVMHPGDLKRLLPGFIEIIDTENPAKFNTTKYISALKLFKPDYLFSVKLVLRYGRAMRISVGSSNMFDLDVRRMAEQILNTLSFLLSE